MEKDKNFQYEEDLDILYVNNNFNNEKVEGTLVFGNIVLDIGKDGKVLGIEVDCPSKIFNFSGEQLSNLNSAKIKIMKLGSILTIGVFLAAEKKEHSFQFALPENEVSVVC